MPDPAGLTILQSVSQRADRLGKRDHPILKCPSLLPPRRGGGSDRRSAGAIDENGAQVARQFCRGLGDLSGRHVVRDDVSDGGRGACHLAEG
jgi:hypothetical protein